EGSPGRRGRCRRGAPAAARPRGDEDGERDPSRSRGDGPGRPRGGGPGGREGGPPCHPRGRRGRGNGRRGRVVSLARAGPGPEWSEPMAKLTLLVSLLAACLSGLAAWSSREAGKDLRAQIDANAILSGRIADLEAAAARRAAPALPPLADAPASSAPSPAPAASLTGRPAAPATVADIDRRLSDLERKEKEYAELVAKWKGAGAGGAAPAPQVAVELPGGGMPAVYNSVEDAEKHLGLSPSQKAEFERA